MFERNRGAEIQKLNSRLNFNPELASNPALTNCHEKCIALNLVCKYHSFDTKHFSTFLDMTKQFNTISDFHLFCF